MYKKLLLMIFIITHLFALSPNDEYNIYQESNYSIIYTKDYTNEAKFIKINIDEFLKTNNKSFGYKFDEPIKIILISNKNQTPNAFSTQVPFNMGVYWNGGAGMNDYFSNNSWLITLFIHEMIHNYQINAKKSKISQTLHKYLGNNADPISAGVPFFTIPNYLLPTALIEGNAVLNESIYNNGGRLHNGTLNALKNSLIFANKIDPRTFINNHLNFPYLTEKYIVGGFYMKYLASIYGVKKVNHFFYEQSIHSINPLLLARTYKKHFNITFEQSILDFVNYSKKTYETYKEEPISNKIAISKSNIVLSKYDNNIYFIASDLSTYKDLYIYDTNKNYFSKEKTTLNKDKVFKINNKLYTSSSGFISTKLYKHGLFDKNNYILKSTIGKSVQDIYKNKISYIKVSKSFMDSKLYVNDKFISNVSSSSLFDKKGNIYYFKQENNKRHLYKNKKIIFSFDGYFSKLVEIYNNEIYFIANSKNGSALYKFKKNKLYKITNSDNIIDAKLIDHNSALVVSVTKDGYEAHTILLKKDIQSNIYNNDTLSRSQNFVFKKDIQNISLKGKSYNEFKQLEYSSFSPYMAYNTNTGLNYSLLANFTDPLAFNTLNLFAFRENNDSLTGASYSHTRYVPVKVTLYDINRQDKYINERGYSASIEVYDTLLRKGRHTINASLKYYLDDENKDKKPLIFTTNHTYLENLEQGKYPYFYSNFKIILKNDQKSETYGFNYLINKHIFNEFYITSQIKAMYNNDKSSNKLEIVNSSINTINDETNIYIEGLKNNFLAKNLEEVSIGFSKVFHFNKYFSKFPISLQDESIFYKYNYYKISTNKEEKIYENIVGINFNLLFLHKFSIPLSLKYIHHKSFMNNNKINLSIGVQF